MPLFYASPAEGVAYLESAAADAGYIEAVYVAHGGKLTALDEAGDEDDNT